MSNSSSSSRTSLYDLENQTSHLVQTPYDRDDAEQQLQDAINTPLDWPYRTRIASFAGHLPHLSSLLGKFRLDEVGVVNTSAFPLPGSAPQSSLRFPFSRLSADLANQDQLLELLKDRLEDNSSPQFKIFIVEDLCPQFLEILGQAFGFPHPDLFAVHLAGSRHKFENLSESLPEEWLTAYFSKPFVTIKWYRPVNRIHMQNGISALEDIRSVIDSPSHSKINADIIEPDEEEDNDVPNAASFLPPWMFKRQKQPNSLRPTSTTNILRACVPLSLEAGPDSGASLPFLWEEKATFLRRKVGQQDHFLILLDPLPTLHMPAMNGQNATTFLPYMSYRRQRSGSWHLPPFGSVYFSQHILENQAKTYSTAEDLMSLLQENQYSGLIYPADPIEALASIVRRDILDTLDVISAALDTIAKLSLDDFQMEKSLDSWRRFMLRMQEIVRSLVRDFQNLVDQNYVDSVPDPVQILLHEVKDGRDKLLHKIHECQAGLRADMGLLENRRGIAEAASVTRLTELAFIFIPLSFVSSVFSMQITELSSGVPATQFIIAAIIVIVLVYGIRILIRARLFISVQRGLLSRARSYLELGPNDPIPTAEFVRFCFMSIAFGDGRIWAMWQVLTGLSVLIVPVALLWTESGLDVTFKGVGTLILIPLSSLSLWMLISILFVSDDTSRWHFSYYQDHILQRIGLKFPNDDETGRDGTASSREIDV